MKKIIASILLASFVSVISLESAIAAETAKLPGESAVRDCYEKAKQISSGKSEVIKEIGGISNPLDSKRNLACKGKVPQDYLYQAIIDVLFTEIDLKVEKYLITLNGTKEPMKSIDDLQKKFGVSGEKGSFDKMYNYACNGGVFYYASAVASDLGDKMTTSDQTFKNNCIVTYKRKMQAYYDAGEVIVARETEKTYETDKKKFMTKIKDKYRDVLFKLTIYLGQLKVINAKWYTNTKNPSN